MSCLFVSVSELWFSPLLGFSGQSCAGVGWCCQNLLCWAGKLWGLFLGWGAAWGEALMWHQHHLSAVWVKNRAEKCLQWKFHFSLVINFLTLFSADTKLNITLLMVNFWRNHICHMEGPNISCSWLLLSILADYILNFYCHKGCAWAFSPHPMASDRHWNMDAVKSDKMKF